MFASGEEGARECKAPQDSYLGLFFRFLRFGFTAFGGPIVQIDMIREELVERERWVSRDHFNRVLALYQVLPGPEAHELCVYFGLFAKGRLGGVLAGLGFMLPGFVLMFLLSWLYLSFGLSKQEFGGFFRGVQPVVIGLIIRAIHHLGVRILYNRYLIAIATLAACVDYLGVSFWLTLPLGGLAYLGFGSGRPLLALSPLAVLLAAALLVPLEMASEVPLSIGGESYTPSLLDLFWSGLKAGLLTFGGAYTVIPFLEKDTVIDGGWMSKEAFLDGIALSGILPAPLVIFSTFIGYLGGGARGALAMTVGVFLPAFCFSLFFHELLERLLHNHSIKSFLDGVTAGVIGIILSTALRLGGAAIATPSDLAIASIALALLYLLRSRASVLFVIFLFGLYGWAFL